MEDVNPDVIKQVFEDFKHDLKNLTYQRTEDENISKACLVCDCLLEWNDTNIIPTLRLKKLKENFTKKAPCSPIFTQISSQTIGVTWVMGWKHGWRICSCHREDVITTTREVSSAVAAA
jgi:hypothetical protein